MDLLKAFRLNQSNRCPYWLGGEFLITLLARVVRSTFTCFAILFATLNAFAQLTQTPTPTGGKYAELPSETPEHFTPVTTSFNFEHRDVMMPMRDGVKLHAVILVPRSAKNAPM